MKGKALIEFEKWLIKKDYEGFDYAGAGGEVYVMLEHIFNDLPKPFQWGVIVDFFDSVGIKMFIIYDLEEDNWCVKLTKPSDFDGKTILSTLRGSINEYLFFKTRKESQQAAIDKATEIFNNR